MEAMSTTIEDLDLKRYGRLLARAVPKVIKTEEENERALAIVESLMEKGEGNMTVEEDALLELLTDLIHDFEEKAYPIYRSPSRTGWLRFCWNNAGWLLKIFGP
jgi:HTH-type transcriptional regulator/antitoxin HigA